MMESLTCKLYACRPAVPKLFRPISPFVLRKLAVSPSHNHLIFAPL